MRRDTTYQTGLKLPDNLVHRLRRSVLEYPVCLLAVQALAWGGLLWGIAGRVVAHFAPTLPDLTLALWLLAMPIVWIGLVQYVVLARLMSDRGGLNDFYVRLFAARRRKGAKDVRDTYTHLREHSNSVFIVVVELCFLACLLALWQTTNHPGGRPIGEVRAHFGVLALASLAVWMVPTLFMWSRANAMEASFAAEPKPFLVD